MVICLERSANDLHMVQLMPLSPHHLCFSKIQNGLSFWYWPTQVVLEKKAVKRLCVCVFIINYTVTAESHGERILQISQHLEKVTSKKKWCLSTQLLMTRFLHHPV